jgi:hypothetical protein
MECRVLADFDGEGVVDSGEGGVLVERKPEL